MSIHILLGSEMFSARPVIGTVLLHLLKGSKTKSEKLTCPKYRGRRLTHVGLQNLDSRNSAFARFATAFYSVKQPHWTATSYLFDGQCPEAGLSRGLSPQSKKLGEEDLFGRRLPNRVLCWLRALCLSAPRLGKYPHAGRGVPR